MSASLSRRGRLLLLSACLLLPTAACGFNEVIDRDEAVKASWSEVENQYQRRADLVPNLVNTVKGAARFVCQPNDDQLVYRPFTACVTYARDGAQPQVDLAVRRAREIASNGNSAIPLVAIAVVGMR